MIGLSDSMRSTTCLMTHNFSHLRYNDNFMLLTSQTKGSNTTYCCKRFNFGYIYTVVISPIKNDANKLSIVQSNEMVSTTLKV